MNTAATFPSGWPAGGRVKFQKYFGRQPLLVNRKARMGRNPGESIQIIAKRVVKFRVAKAAKDAILGVKK